MHDVSDNRRKVECAFWDQRNQRLHLHEVTVRTTSGPDVVAIRQACEDYAKTGSFSWWAMPAELVRDDQSPTHVIPWMTFEVMVGTRLGKLRDTFPTKAAAEMWLIHRHAHA